MSVLATAIALINGWRLPAAPYNDLPDVIEDILNREKTFDTSWEG